jgi:hypothetical protein
MYRFREGEGHGGGGGHHGDGAVIALVSTELPAFVTGVCNQSIALSTYRYESEFQVHGLAAPEHALSPVWFRGRHLIVTPERREHEVECIMESFRIGDSEMICVPMPVWLFAETRHIDFPCKAPGTAIVFGMRTTVAQRVLIAVVGDVHV